MRSGVRSPSAPPDNYKGLAKFANPFFIGEMMTGAIETFFRCGCNNTDHGNVFVIPDAPQLNPYRLSIPAFV